MKRLLLPLIAALALPIPVNANPFSGDLILKTNVGEKFLIKKTTVRTLGVAEIKEIIEFSEEFNKNELEDLISNDYPKNYLELVKKIEREFTSKKNKLEEPLKNLRKEMDSHRLNMIKLFDMGKEIDNPIYQKASKNWDRVAVKMNLIYEEVNNLRASKNKEIKSLKNDERKILIDNLQKEFSNNVLVERISFTPIKTDLNNTQYVLPEYNIQCVNPKFKNGDLKNIISKYISANSFINISFDYKYLKQFNYDPEERICDKYAKF